MNSNLSTGSDEDSMSMSSNNDDTMPDLSNTAVGTKATPAWLIKRNEFKRTKQT